MVSFFYGPSDEGETKQSCELFCSTRVPASRKRVEFTKFEAVESKMRKVHSKKSGFAAPPAAGVRSKFAFLKPCAFLKSTAFQKILHGNIIIFYCIGTKFPIQ